MRGISTSGEPFIDKGPLGAPGIFWRPSIIVLTLGVTLSLLLSACGGGGGDEGGGEPEVTQLPTQSSGNGGEATTATNGDGEPSMGSGTEEYFVPATQWKVLALKLNVGDTVQVNYKSEFLETGGSVDRIVGGSTRNFGDIESGVSLGGIESGVLVVVKNPIGEDVLQVEQKSEGTVEVTADISGEYTFTFFNSFRMQSLSVDVEYAINP